MYRFAVKKLYGETCCFFQKTSSFKFDFLFNYVIFYFFRKLNRCQNINHLFSLMNLRLALKFFIDATLPIKFMQFFYKNGLFAKLCKQRISAAQKNNFFMVIFFKCSKKCNDHYLEIKGKGIKKYRFFSGIMGIFAEKTVKISLYNAFFFICFFVRPNVKKIFIIVKPPKFF